MMLFVIFAHKINCTSTKIAGKLDALLLVYTIFVPKTSRLWQTILKHRLCFGVRVEGDTFTDRKEETERLKANFTYGVNTILISPRRMGKTSLVDKVCSLVESENIRIARIDAF